MSIITKIKLWRAKRRLEKIERLGSPLDIVGSLGYYGRKKRRYHTIILSDAKVVRASMKAEEYDIAYKLAKRTSENLTEYMKNLSEVMQDMKDQFDRSLNFSLDNGIQHDQPDGMFVNLITIEENALQLRWALNIKKDIDACIDILDFKDRESKSD